ncbi:MAG: hypothetical protein KGY74_05510 [Candidatus Cloacimonetes bacterium]|nr:hypothetical protein [Candidatus Cloacimonadota bacterium]
MLKELIKLFKKSNLYQEAHEDACEMLNRANKMFDNASAKLRGRKVPHTDVDIFSEERKVDKTERAVRKKVLIHLSASGTKDTPGAIILICIVIDIERVGDYTTNILELTQSVNKPLKVGELEEELTNIERQIENLFDVVSIAFENYDKEEAKKVINKKITGKCETLLHKLISGETSLDEQTAVIAALYIRYLKRVSAHLLNIATSLVQPFERAHFLPKSLTKKYKENKKNE